MRRHIGLAGAIVAALTLNTANGAQVLNLTTTSSAFLTANDNPGSIDTYGNPVGTGTINGAQFFRDGSGPAGTGNLSPFLRINPGGGNNNSQGVNSDGTNPQFDEDPSQTSSLLLADVPLKDLNSDGILYREFLLDINQANGNVFHYLTLNELKIFTGTSTVPFGSVGGDGEFSLSPTDANGTPYSPTAVYDLDGAGDAGIVLDHDLTDGSGRSDLKVYVLNSLFTVFSPSPTYVYLYSQFGRPPGGFDDTAGFQEWATRGEGGGITVQNAPEPATVGMALSGILPLAFVGLRRLRRRTAANPA